MRKTNLSTRSIILQAHVVLYYKSSEEKPQHFRGFKGLSKIPLEEDDISGSPPELLRKI